MQKAENVLTETSSVMPSTKSLLITTQEGCIDDERQFKIKTAKRLVTPLF